MNESDLEKKWIEYSDAKLDQYEKWYYHEINRDDRISRKIQFSTTLLIATGTLLFYLSLTFINTTDWKYETTNFLLIILLTISWILLLLYIIKIIKAYHGMSRAYLHLPDPENLRSREKEVYCHYYKQFLINPEKGISTRTSSFGRLEKHLKNEKINYLISTSSNNFKINNFRENQLFKSRLHLVMTLIFITFSSIILLYKNYVEENHATATASTTYKSENTQNYTSISASTEDEIIIMENKKY